MRGRSACTPRPPARRHTRPPHNPRRRCSQPRQASSARAIGMHTMSARAAAHQPPSHPSTTLLAAKASLECSRDRHAHHVRPRGDAPALLTILDDAVPSQGEPRMLARSACTPCPPARRHTRPSSRFSTMLLPTKTTRAARAIGLAPRVRPRGDTPPPFTPLDDAAPNQTNLRRSCDRRGPSVLGCGGGRCAERGARGWDSASSARLSLPTMFPAEAVLASCADPHFWEATLP